MNKSQLKKIRRKKKVAKMIKQKRLGIGKGCEGLRGRFEKDELAKQNKEIEDWENKVCAEKEAAHAMKEVYENK